MITLFRLALVSVTTFAALALGSCGPDAAPARPGVSEKVITNRLAVTPEIVGNLGISFERATRGQLGVWITIPGELVIPEHGRFALRAPAPGRVMKILPRWSNVARGDVVAEISSAVLRKAQQDLLAAESALRNADSELSASRDRLLESETQLEHARDLAEATRRRADELKGLASDANAFSTKEFLAAQISANEAAQAALDAAVNRDALRSKTQELALRARQARFYLEETLSVLSAFTGRAREDSSAAVDGVDGWVELDSILVRAPADGVVAEVNATSGELVEGGAPLLSILDSTELRFRGHLPEGDMGIAHEGDMAVVEFASPHVEPVETKLIGPFPVASGPTRTLRFEAVVPNRDRRLAEFISATARVRVREGEHEEVIVPSKCVVFDGLEAIVFRRDPNDGQFVIRTPVELGLRAAGRVEILSGVLDGDSLVADGVHQLKHTGLGKAPEGGHFHADGTWHKGNQ